MTDRARDADAGYVIRTGSAAVARLEPIARLFWPTTEAVLTRVGALAVPRSQGLATDAEVADLVARLDAWAEEPGVVATLPRIVQVTARAPHLA